MALARAPMSAREARALPGFVLRLLPRCGTIDGLSMSTASSSIAPDVDPAVLHDVEDSNLYNVDLAPVPRDRRKWRVGGLAAARDYKVGPSSPSCVAGCVLCGRLDAV